MTAPLRRPLGRSAAAVGLALAAVLLGACVDADLQVVDASATEQLATSSTVVEEAEGALPIGAAAATPRGNTVAVLDADTDADQADVLVEACAAPEAEEDVGVSLSFFSVRLDEGSSVTPTEPDDAREPPLRTRHLEPGVCTVGWLAFDLRDAEGAGARYLLFGSRSSAIVWDLRLDR